MYGHIFISYDITKRKEGVRNLTNYSLHDIWKQQTWFHATDVRIVECGLRRAIAQELKKWEL